MDEPQLERCRKSVHIQRFDRVSEVGHVSPFSVAFNLATGNPQHELIVVANGDFIFYPDAKKIILETIGSQRGFYKHNFGLFDNFLKTKICCCQVYDSAVVAANPHRNEFRCDVHSTNRVKRKGFKTYTHLGTIVGSHFDDPTERQVYRRFFFRGQKPKSENYEYMLHDLVKKHGDNRYLVALEGIRDGRKAAKVPHSNDDRVKLGRMQ
jgi:hypothetical protein